MIAAPVADVLRLALDDPAALHMARIEVDGRPYVPVWAGPAQYADMDALNLLSEVIDARAAGCIRRLRCVVADEGAPRAPVPGTPADRLAAHGKRLRLAGIACPVGTIMVLCDDGPPIGTVESAELVAPGETPDTEGACWVATVVFEDTVLASIAWQAIEAGVLGAISPSLTVADTSEPAWSTGVITRLCLVATGTGCLPNARVLATWEGPGGPRIDDREGGRYLSTPRGYSQAEVAASHA